ncbi:hypothetical protein [Novosphingobium terrae]|uniref:hypothetical protein n=1 Tax=Novosphingobium terrae TaxID=2726189 RepID=UPI001980AB1B|nr:hypothetical protein [Novosphingobium terrae]
MIENEDRQDGGRFSLFLNKVERIYLVMLRAVTLVIATILLVGAVWLGLSGAYKISRDAGAVKEAEAKVSSDDVTKIDAAPEAARSEVKSDADPQNAEKAYVKSFAQRYFALYRKNFETYRQAGDTPLTEQDFDSRFLSEGLTALVDHKTPTDDAVSTPDFATIKSQLEALYDAMDEAAKLPLTQERLKTYKSAQRKRVETQVNKTREERYCSYWGSFINECISYGTRTVPYTETQVIMELPKGVLDPAALFGQYQKNYIQTLNERRDESATNAKTEREKILAGNIAGHANVILAIQIIGGFLVLMFFFLLIAIERHQRKIAVTLKVKD